MQLNRSASSFQRCSSSYARKTARAASRFIYLRAVASAEISTSRTVHESDVALLPLLAGVRAHESSLSAMRVLEDSKDGSKVLVTASMDKTIAAWRLLPNLDGDPAQPYYVEVQKIAVPGGPIFAIAPLRTNPTDQQPVKASAAAVTADGTGNGVAVPTIFCGNAAKEVVSWQPFMPSFTDLTLGGHTGWVRAVATYDKYLFSCGCNYLRQWDCTFATPKELNSVKLFTGDILAIAAGKGYVYTAGADGSLRSWSVDKATGDMAEWAMQEGAHDGRICVLVLHGDHLYSSGVDGVIRMWNKDTMEMMGQVTSAHDGEKVQCMAVGGNGVLYSGGDDRMIRAWVPGTLEPLSGFKPLEVHGSSVRSLAAGRSELLVSGDAEGFVNFFRVPNVPPAAVMPSKNSELARFVADMFASASSPGSSQVTTTVLEDPWLSATPGLNAEPQAGDASISTLPAALAAAAVISSHPITEQVDASEFDASLSPKPDEPEEESLSTKPEEPEEAEAFLDGTPTSILTDPMATVGYDSDEDEDHMLNMSVSNLMDIEPGEAPGSAMGCLGCMAEELDRSRQDPQAAVMVDQVASADTELQSGGDGGSS